MTQWSLSRDTLWLWPGVCFRLLEETTVDVGRILAVWNPDTVQRARWVEALEASSEPASSQEAVAAHPLPDWSGRGWWILELGRVRRDSKAKPLRV